MKITLTILTSFFISTSYVYAQPSNGLVKKGNDDYKKGDLKAATENYRKALAKDKDNKAARFNLGNALQKQNQGADAENEYNGLLNSNADDDLKSKASYNKGLSLVQQKKLAEAADAFKQSLKENPADNETRENLQKVLNEIKKQQQQQQNQQQQKKEQKKEEEQKKQQQEQSKTKLSQQKAEQLLSQLREKEKQLQGQLQKQKTNTQQQEKDW